MTAPSAQPPSKVLIVDDEPNVRKALSRLLTGSGYEVVAAPDAETALKLARGHRLAAVVTDIVLPGMDGIELLRRLRVEAPDLPVVVITGGPKLESAIDAMRYGALRYLVKPVDPEELRQVLRDAMHLGEIAAARRALVAHVQQRRAIETAASAELSGTYFAALEDLKLHFQPIVDAEARRIYAFEALVRPQHPELRTPEALLKLGEQIAEIPELGRAVRRLAGNAIASLPTQTYMFVNLHVAELGDDDLYSAASPLDPARVVFEITERHSLTDDPSVHRNVRRLKALGYRIAIDDFGAGHAGLTSFAVLEPDIVKLDMELVRDVDRIATKRQLVASVVRACEELGVMVVAEGVEREQEMEALRNLGCSLFQGFLFARPDVPYTTVQWPGAGEADQSP